MVWKDVGKCFQGYCDVQARGLCSCLYLQAFGEILSAGVVGDHHVAGTERMKKTWQAVVSVRVFE